MKKFDSTKLGQKLNKVGFWVLIVLLIGVLLGSFGSRIYFNTIIKDSITMGRFIYNGKVYDIGESRK